MKFIYLFVLFFYGYQASAQMRCGNLFNQNTTQIAEQTLKDKVKMAVVQYPLDEGLTEVQFLQKIEGYILKAKKQKSEFVVFPELVTTELVDWAHPDGETAQLNKIASEFTPKYKRWLIKKAKQHNITILGGTTPQVKNKNIVNTALIATAEGKLLEQDKIFLTPDEKDWGWTAGKTLKIYDTVWGKMAILICFDSEFPVLSQKLAESKPDLIIIPSWTSTESGFNRVDWSSRARAIEHYAYVVKNGTVRSDTSTQPHFGNAVIFTPQESGFSTKPKKGRFNKDAILYQTLDLAFLRQKKAASGYYPGNEQSNRTDRIILIKK